MKFAVKPVDSDAETDEGKVTAGRTPADGFLFGAGNGKTRMGLYNFQKRFVPFILDGRKTHTIRATRMNPDKPGNMLHLYTGLRLRRVKGKSQAKLLMRVPCVKVEEIRITQPTPVAEQKLPHQLTIVEIDGNALDRAELEELAKRDGFCDFADMMSFWKGRLPFEGQIIHWKRR